MKSVLVATWAALLISGCSSNVDRAVEPNSLREDAAAGASDVSTKPDLSKAHLDLRDRRDRMPSPDKRPVPDTAPACPTKGSAACYSLFKYALIQCHCSQGKSWTYCMNYVSQAQWGALLARLGACVEKQCDLCKDKGYDALSNCVRQKCTADALCCFAGSS